MDMNPTLLPLNSYEFNSYKPVRHLSPDEKSQIKKNFLYKYLNEDGFKGTLANGIRFVEPSKWNDKFETRFSTANYQKINPSFPKRLYATCFTSAKNNEAAWKAYMDPTNPLKTPSSQMCFRLKINRKHLKLKLMEIIGYKFYEAPVVYLPEYTISNMHMPNIAGATRIHNSFFQNQPFDLDKFLSLLIIKREHFSYEQEVRYFAVPDIDPAIDDLEPRFFIKEILEIVDEIFVTKPYGDFKLSNEDLDKIADEYAIDRKILKTGDIYEDNTPLPITIEP